MPRVVFLFFFFSGFSALIYEVAWVRILSLTLGNTVYATSTVLAVFMGGLAAGAWIGGRLADRIKADHLKLYGVLELGIAVTAPLVTWLLGWTPELYAKLVESLPAGDLTLAVLRLSFSGLLLLIPCLFMGATLPAIIRFVKGFAPPEQLFSSLYGTNTLGAAAGSFFACFIGFSYLGINSTIFSAAAINLVIGGFAVYLQRSLQPAVLANAANVDTAVPDSDSMAGPTDTDQYKAPLALLLTLSFLTGFTALSYEVLWTRVLVFWLRSITYTFTTMVGVFLVGLALGSFLYERFLFKKNESHRRTFLIFGIAQCAAALASLAAFLATPYAVALRTMWMAPGDSIIDNIHGQLAYTMLVSVACLLGPATLIGVLFPALGTLASRSVNVGAAVGAVYGINTIGCVVGSICAGLLLIPTIGTFASFKLILVLSVITGIIALIYDWQIKRPVILAWSAPTLILMLCFAKFVHERPNINPNCQLLFCGEDALGIVQIVDDPRGMEGKTLAFNGSCLAATIPCSRRYMRLLGHLPLLLHKNAEHVLLGCFGTGTTAGAIAIHPGVRSLDIVELSPMILQQGHLFAQENYDVLKNSKVRTHITDVRNYLLTDKNKYEVITFEPPPPQDAGIVNLYSQEFYELVKARLSPGGIVCQWVPMDCVPKRVWKMMIATARAVFPYVQVWLPNAHEAVFVASDEPMQIDFARFQDRIDALPEVQKSLADVGLGSAAEIVSTFAVTDNALDEFLKDSPDITDDHPRLEFFLPYAGQTLSDLELEEPGRSQMASLLNQGLKTPSFDKDKFVKSLKAVHLLREVLYADSQTGQQMIEQTVKLMPDNEWFKYVNRHQDECIKGQL